MSFIKMEDIVSLKFCCPTSESVFEHIWVSCSRKSTASRSGNTWITAGSNRLPSCCCRPATRSTTLPRQSAIRIWTTLLNVLLPPKGVRRQIIEKRMGFRDRFLFRHNSQNSWPRFAASYNLPRVFIKFPGLKDVQNSFIISISATGAAPSKQK